MSLPAAIQIPGLAGWYQETTARYDHAARRCAICGGVGFAWHGWFSCDGTCGGVAVIATGQTFLSVAKQLPQTQEDTP